MKKLQIPCVLMSQIALIAGVSSVGSASEVLLSCKPGEQGGPLAKVQIVREITGEFKSLIIDSEELEYWENSNALEWHMKNLTLPNFENKAYRLRLSSDETLWTLVEFTIDNFEYYFEMICEGPSIAP